MGEPTTRTQQKRAAVLRAALESFRDEGYHATSMDRLAERAGVSKRTVYHHFASKDALFDEVVAHLWTRLLRAAELRGATAEVAVTERLVTLAQALLEVLLEPDVLGLFRIVLAESVRTPALGRAFRSDRDPLELFGVSPLLRDEVRLGRLRIDRIDIAAIQFWGLTIDGVFWRRALGVPAPAPSPELMVRDGVRVFLSHYAAEGAVPAVRPRPARGRRK